MDILSEFALSDLLTLENALYVLLGFIAQLVDGALGMAFGLIVTMTLLSVGFSPAMASASTHAAEIVTTGLAGGSHVWHRNVDWKLFAWLAPAGVLGGATGAYMLTQVPEEPVKVLITLYLLFMVALIARRIYKGTRKRDHNVPTAPIGLGGGFFDAMGGGGWGPLVTSTLVTRGENPRCSVGSATLAEFFVTLVVSTTFLWHLDMGRYALTVLGLIAGGALAAPFAGLISKMLPQRVMLVMLAGVIFALALYNLIFVIGELL